MGWHISKYRQPVTTTEFVEEQGIVYVLCPKHLHGKPYIRYLIVGYDFIDDPTLRQIFEVRQKFRHVVIHFVNSVCPNCKGGHGGK